MTTAMRVPAATSPGAKQVVVGRAVASATNFIFSAFIGATRMMQTPTHRPPETCFLLGPLVPGWAFKQPFQVQIEQDEEGNYVVSDDQFAVYGVGEDRPSAIKDYLVSLVEYYELVEVESADHPPTSSLLRRLERVVAKPNPSES
jgi:hypothetical protein